MTTTLTTKEAAEVLAAQRGRWVSTRHVQYLAATKRIPGAQKDENGKWRFPIVINVLPSDRPPGRQRRMPPLLGGLTSM